MKGKPSGNLPGHRGEVQRPSLGKSVAMRGSNADDRVHNPTSSRLDARGIANLIGLSLPQFCAAIGREYDSTKKTSDSWALQILLAQIFRIWDIALEAFKGDENAVRRWLLRPNRALERERPIDLLRADRIDELEAAVKRMRDADYA